jgi:hypothetical protein
MNRIDQKAFETVLSIPFINGNPGNAVAYLAINAVSDHPLANEEFCRAYYAETEDNKNARPYMSINRECRQERQRHMGKTEKCPGTSCKGVIENDPRN